MLKRDLRLSYLAHRAALSDENIRLQSEAITALCLTLPIWAYATYHIFLSIPSKGEVDTRFMMAAIREKGGKIAVPKIAPGRQLSHHHLEENTILRENAWGIPEPEGSATVRATDIDVVFLPLLAFDRKGYRVGYGGGYYDRFLAACRPDVIKVGLSFFAPVDAIEDLHPEDIAMDYCVTPEKIFSF